MSRNARSYICKSRGWFWFFVLLLPFSACGQAPALPSLFSRVEASPSARVVIAHDAAATEAFQPRPERMLPLVNRALTRLTQQPTPAAAWRSLISTQDVVGIKVYSAPGAQSGTRPAVAAAVIEGLLAAGLPPRQIIVWDKYPADLRRAGFFELARRYGVRVESSIGAGFEESVFYETALVGHLIWGDLEFGREGAGVARKSFVTKLLTRDITKIINLPPLLNHYRAGVTGNLFSLAIGSVDNTIRFENSANWLATAVPEIYAVKEVGDRVVLNIVDALICQYRGEQRTLLHYSTALNELRVSTDPVALDVLSLQELNRQRQAVGVTAITNNLELYHNAALLELGISNPDNIRVERVDERSDHARE